jgi:acetyl-CoA carboxylase biotin carboxyl carrier protein
VSDGASLGDGGSVSRLLRVIDRLEQMLEASELVELEVEAGGTIVVLRKPEAIAPIALTSVDGDATGGDNRGGSTGSTATAVTTGLPGAAGAGLEAEAASPFHAVLAPLTGVYYTSPSPGAAPYVRVGSPVTQGQVIGLIEAMKLFNEIKADASGIVRRIASETGALVKAKQTLIEIEIETQ